MLKFPPRTDAGNAELFARLYKDSLRFDHARNRWLFWKGHWWAEDVNGEIRRLAIEAVRLRYKGALKIPDPEQRKQQALWALKSESRSSLDSMLALAQSAQLLADAGTDWDANPWLLGVANGVVDLRTGRLRKGRQSDRITIHSQINFDPSAQCPRWNQFLQEIFSGDTELIEFVDRAVGYSLTGDTSEQCVFLCHGGGGNGKSTFLETLLHVLGAHAYNMPFSTLELLTRSSIPNDLAALAGRRLVISSETNESARLNEARLKALTGCDSITARFLHREFFTFRPVAKFWLSFNHRPRVADDSHGFWRRIRLIPCLQKFEVNNTDLHLPEKLWAEAEGILARGVRGCLAWQKDGLGLPGTVKAGTEAYREEMDPLREFIEERCIVHPQAKVEVWLLFSEYLTFARENALRWPLDRRAFTGRMEARGFKKIRWGHARTWCWAGICRHWDAKSQGIPTAADMRTHADIDSSVFPNGDLPI